MCKHVCGINQWKIRLTCFLFYTNRFLTFNITTKFWSQSDTPYPFLKKRKINGSDIFEYLSEDTGNYFVRPLGCFSVQRQKNCNFSAQLAYSWSAEESAVQQKITQKINMEMA